MVGLLIGAGEALGVHGRLPENFWLHLAILAVISGFCFFFMWRSLRRKHLIEDTPTARVASAPQGYVELNGEVEVSSEGFLRSPLKGLECLWYRFRVERRTRDSRGRTRWSLVQQGQSSRGFFLRDGTGDCWVVPVGAEVDPQTRDVWFDSSNPMASPSTGWNLFGERYRFTEERIHAKETLYALGWFQTLAGGADLASEVRARLTALKKDPIAMKRYDRNGDGQVDIDEWDEARAAVSRDAARDLASQPVPDATHTLSLPADGNLPFLLSGRSQEALARRYGWRAAGGLAGFLGAGAAAVVYYFQH